VYILKPEKLNLRKGSQKTTLIFISIDIADNKDSGNKIHNTSKKRDIPKKDWFMNLISSQNEKIKKKICIDIDIISISTSIKMPGVIFYLDHNLIHI